jgi:hypothetical protein
VNRAADVQVGDYIDSAVFGAPGGAAVVLSLDWSNDRIAFRTYGATSEPVHFRTEVRIVDSAWARRARGLNVR